MTLRGLHFVKATQNPYAKERNKSKLKFESQNVISRIIFTVIMNVLHFFH